MLELTPRFAQLYELQAALLEPRLEAIGIGLSTFQLLSAVRGAGDQASQAEIARRLAVTPATLSETVAGHVRRGLLEQTRSPQDKRVRILVLTAQADELLDRALVEIGVIETLLREAIPDTARATLTKTMDRLIATMEKALES